MAESEDQQAIRSIRFGIASTPCRSCGDSAVRDVDGLTSGIPSLNQVFLDGHCTAAATAHTGGTGNSTDCAAKNVEMSQSYSRCKVPSYTGFQVLSPRR